MLHFPAQRAAAGRTCKWPAEPPRPTTPAHATAPFRGMAPTAARRARPVQRNHFQGLQGNPDACCPRRGSACSISANQAGGNASPVPAGRTQRTAAMSPRSGGRRGERPPGPFFSPISLGRNGGARRAGAPRAGALGEMISVLTKAEENGIAACQGCHTPQDLRGQGPAVHPAPILHEVLLYIAKITDPHGLPRPILPPPGGLFSPH